MDNMYLIMIDECGDEVVHSHYRLSGLLDADEEQIWKERKVEKAWEDYPEARGFYWEDRRSWYRGIY